MKRLLLIGSVLAMLVAGGDAQAFGRKKDCCPAPVCYAPAPACAVTYVEQVVTTYKTEIRERDVTYKVLTPVTVKKTFKEDYCVVEPKYKDEMRDVTTYKMVSHDEMRDVTTYKMVSHDEMRDVTTYKMVGKEEMRDVTTYKMVGTEVVRDVVSCHYVPCTVVDPCTGCCRTVCQPVTTVQKVKCMVYECKPFTEKVKVMVYECKPFTEKVKVTVHECKPVTEKVKVTVQECKPVTEKVKVRVCEYVTKKMSRNVDYYECSYKEEEKKGKERYCVTVPVKTVIKVPCYVPCCN